MRSFVQLSGRMGSLADVLRLMAGVGRRREAGPAAALVDLTMTRLVLISPALSLILPRPRVGGLQPRHLLSSVLAATAAPPAAAAVAGLHLTVVRVRSTVVRRPGGLAGPSSTHGSRVRLRLRLLVAWRAGAGVGGG